ncbi:LuxR C-terminal-related transcriptional regulator [Kineococcus sp. LSe6-4]|uniref:LuxR C-terminal-related transcriptional regulator n=1 Tax=Kineococcus halophytocola TaxID=3234027 RepID=A0ABV4H5M5_9ACTN
MSSPVEAGAGPAGSTALTMAGDVLAAPLLEVAGALSRHVAGRVRHEALVVFTERCTGHPRKTAGRPQITERVTIAEMVAVLDLVLAAGGVLDGPARVAGAEHVVHARVARDGRTLLVLVDPRPRPGASWEAVRDLFEIAALSIAHRVGFAGPQYLADSRAASAERARAVAESTELQLTTLETLLGVLRSATLDDATARARAEEIASQAVLAQRRLRDANRAFTEEPALRAFSVLRAQVESLVKHRDVELDFVEPPADGRPVPGEVANAARAVLREAILVMVAQEGVRRLRVQWDCDGRNLLFDLRDDGGGRLREADIASGDVRARVSALGGEVSTEIVPGWGSRLSARLPLDAAAVPERPRLAGLQPREQEVLRHLADGARNRAIATTLGISENTVKFHVANVLRKLGVSSRAEAVALLHEQSPG